MNTEIETLAKAKILEIAVELERMHGAMESDWDMAQIWRDFTNGELEPLYEGLIKLTQRQPLRPSTMRCTAAKQTH